MNLCHIRVEGHWSRRRWVSIPAWQEIYLFSKQCAMVKKNEQLPSWRGQRQLYLSLLGKYCSSQRRILIRRSCLSEGYNAALRTIPLDITSELGFANWYGSSG